MKESSEETGDRGSSALAEASGQGQKPDETVPGEEGVKPAPRWQGTADEAPMEGLQGAERTRLFDDLVEIFGSGVRRKAGEQMGDLFSGREYDYTPEDFMRDAVEELTPGSLAKVRRMLPAVHAYLKERLDKALAARREESETGGAGDKPSLRSGHDGTEEGKPMEGGGEEKPSLRSSHDGAGGKEGKGKEPDLFDFTNPKEDYYSGVMHSDGFRWATDGNLMVRRKAGYDPSLEGKMLDREGREVERHPSPHGYRSAMVMNGTRGIDAARLERLHTAAVDAGAESVVVETGNGVFRYSTASLGKMLEEARRLGLGSLDVGRFGHLGFDVPEEAAIMHGEERPPAGAGGMVMTEYGLAEAEYLDQKLGDLLDKAKERKAVDKGVDKRPANVDEEGMVVAGSPAKPAVPVGKGVLPAGTEAPYSITPDKYITRRGKQLDTWLVRFNRDFSKEELSALTAKAKAMRGWYDREGNGWRMRSGEDAKALAEEVAAKGEEELADEAPLSMADMEKPAEAGTQDRNSRGRSRGDSEAAAKPAEGSPVKKVDVEGMFDALRTKGETRLDEHAEPVERPEEAADNPYEPGRKLSEELRKVGYTTDRELVVGRRYRTAEGDEMEVTAIRGASVTFRLYEEGRLRSTHEEPYQAVLRLLEPEPQPKPRKRSRWISDEDADEFDSLRKDLRSHFGKDGDIVEEVEAGYGKPEPKPMDAEVLRMGTRMTYLMMKGGLRSFSDYCDAMKEELPDIFDEMRPHLKSLYAATQNMEEVMRLGWDEEMDDRKTVKAFDVYNFDKPGAKDIIATAQHVVDENASRQQAEQIVETLKEQRNEQRRKEAEGGGEKPSLRSGHDGAGGGMPADGGGEKPSLRSGRDGAGGGMPADGGGEKPSLRSGHDGTEKGKPETLSGDGLKPILDILKGGGLKAGKEKQQRLAGLMRRREAFVLDHPETIPIFRTGSSYQMLSADAEEGSRLTGHPLSRFTMDGREVPYLEFTHRMLEKYLPQLVRGGKRVALMEELEEPAGSPRKDVNLKPEEPKGNSGKPERDKNDGKRDNDKPGAGMAEAELLHSVGSDASGPDGGLPPAGAGATGKGGHADGSGPAMGGGTDRTPHGTDAVGGLQSPVGDRGRDEGGAAGGGADATVERGGSVGGGSLPGGNAHSGAEGVPEGESAAGTGGAGESSALGSPPVRGGSSSRPAQDKPDGEPRTRNFSYSRQNGNEADGYTPAQRLEANVRALETLAEVLFGGKPATREQQAVMSRFRGWGQVDLGKHYSIDNILRSTGSHDPINRLAKVIQRLDPSGEKKLFEAIKRASLSSYYTPTPIARAMNTFLELAGFRGGSLLAPSMGNGMFEGTLPEALQGRISITGVELDWLSGQLARALYPDAKVVINGFEKAGLAPGSFDVVTSNVPFGDIAVNDPSWSSDSSPIKRSAQHRIHNYYAVKMLESARPGGLVAMMTTSAVMDTPSNQNIRAHIAEQGEIVGAVRLPDNTFQGTGVVTDIIFIRKWRDAEDRARTRARESYMETERAFLSQHGVTAPGKQDGKEQNVRYNGYYGRNPQNMIGTVQAGNQYGKEDAFGLTSKMTVDEIAGEVEKAVERIVGDRRGSLFNPSRTIMETQQAVREEYKGSGDWVSSGNMVVQDGKVGTLSATVNEYGEKSRTFEGSPKHQRMLQRVEAMIGVRTAMKRLIAAQIEGQREKTLARLRRELMDAYDNFTTSYGRLQEKQNAFILDDIDGYTIQALEHWRNGKFEGLSDIFTKNSIKPQISLEGRKTPQEAVALSLAEYGCLRPDYLSEALGEDWARQCGDMVFLNPESTGDWVTRDEYLSGDVVTKLAQARAAAERDSSFERNVRALEEVQPAPVYFDDIAAHLGARWIPSEILNDFVREVFGLHTPSGRRAELVDGEWIVPLRSGVVYVPELDSFQINFDKKELGGEAQDWTTARKSAAEILQAALEDKTLVVKDKEGNTDEEQTELANQKVADLRERFDDWLPGDPGRVELIERTYNEKFNRTVNRKFDGSHLVVPGLMGKELRPHQKDAVWMIMNNRGGIVDHIVGAGKTLVMQSAIMEMRRTGIARKPMIVALKSTVQQIARDFKQSFPSARVLAPGDDDFGKENRKKFLAKIALNDYDCVILSHEQYCMLPHTAEAERAVIDEQLWQLDNLIKYLYGTGDKSQMTKKQIKALEKRKQNLLAKLESRLDRKVDREFCFENLGVDYLFVDESHQFKSLPYVTNYQNVAGLGDAKGSNRAVALLTGVRYLQRMHQGDKGTIFLSGTTITNSLVEIYNLLNYLRPRKMAELGLTTFDAWASTFAVHSSELEAGTTGSFAMRDRFRNFNNVPELSRLYTEIADVRNDQNLKLPKPSVKAVTHIVPASKQMQEINREIVNMLTQRNGDYFGIVPKDPAKAPWGLHASTISAKAAVSPRLIFPDWEDEGGKVHAVCEEVSRMYKETDEFKGVQLIFCEMGVPGKDKKYDAYNDIRERLVNDYGIPRNEIVFIQEAPTEEKRKDLFQKVRDGKVRVLIGGTKNMGTGVNVQDRITDAHMLTVPWTPSALEQCIGRAARQGNIVARDFLGDKVRVHYYATEGSLDLYKYQLLDAKGKMLTQFKMGAVDGSRSFDEGSADEEGNMDPAEMVAILSGNPVIFERAKQEKLVKKLKNLRNGFEREYQRKKAGYDKLTQSKKKLERLIKLNNADREAIEKEGFLPDENGKYPTKVIVRTGSAYLGGEEFERPKEAGKYIHKLLAEGKQVWLCGYGKRAKVITENNEKEGLFSAQQMVTIGDERYDVVYKVPLSDDDTAAGTAFRNLMQQIINRGNVFKHSLEEVESNLSGMNVGDGVFPRQAELDQAQARLKELNAEYNKLGAAAKPVGAGEPEMGYSAENANFERRYETQDGKTLRYTSENPESYGGLFDFDFSGEQQEARAKALSAGNSGGEAETGDAGRVRGGADGLQRQGDSLLYPDDSGLNEAGGEFCQVERVFRKNGSFSFTGAERIESADDVAFIFSALEDAAKEHSFVVFVKEGKPTVVELGMGTFTATLMDMPTAALAYDRINPDEVYFVHNHPSGNLKCSPQDVQMLERFEKMSDVPVHGVIINLKSGKYGTFDTAGTAGEGRKRIPENELPLAVHTLDKQIFSPDYDPMAQPLVRGSADVAAFLNSHRMGDRGKVSFLIMNRAGRIVGNIHTPWTGIPADATEMARYISERVIRFGGANAILYGDFPSGSRGGYSGLRRLMKEHGDVGLLDVVRTEGNRTRSAADDGLLWEPGSDYGAKFVREPDGGRGRGGVDADMRFREVEDEEVLKEFAEGKTVKVYRTMQVIDGRLYSPMATKVGGRETPEIRLGVPEQAEEHPEIVTKTKMDKDGYEVGYITLDKGLGKGQLRDIAYNSYIHASFSPVNDQFTSCHIRPNLVLVESLMPESELVSGYRARYAKNAVGVIPWHSGTVSGQLARLGRPRRVMLSRYDMPVRIVPNREVARMIAEQLEGTGIEIPYNVVTPQVRAELEKLGVPISGKASGRVGGSRGFGDAEYITDEEIERMNARGREMARSEPEAMRRHAEALAGRLGTPVRVVTDVEELRSGDAAMQARMRRSKGFFDPATGEVVVVVPNHATAGDVAETVLHEVVAHRGLREMVGEENYGAFCDEIYGHLKDDLKEEVDRDATRRFQREPEKDYGNHRRVAVDEMLGRMAEKGFEDFTKAERGIWRRLKERVLEAINRFLGSLRLPKWVRLGDNELRYMLWRSHERLRAKTAAEGKGAGGNGDSSLRWEHDAMDYVDMAHDAAKRAELGLDGNDVVRVKSEAKTTADRIEESFNAAVAGELKGKPVEIGRLTKEGKAYLEKLSGLKLKDNVKFKLNPSDLVHIYKDHFGTNEKDPGQNIPLTRDDIRKIADILANPDKVLFGTEKGGDNRKMFFFLKSDEATGAYNLLEIYANAWGNLTSKSFYRTKKSVSQRVLSLMKSEHLTSVTDGPTLNSEAKLPKFFDIPTIAKEESLEFRFRDGETDDIWDDKSMGLEERITQAAIRLSDRQKGDLTLRNDARRAVVENLQSLLHDMRNRRGATQRFATADRKVEAGVTGAINAQATFDRATVKRVTDLARVLMQGGWLSGMTGGEMLFAGNPFLPLFQHFLPRLRVAYRLLTQIG